MSAVDSATSDYYAVLGLEPDATTDEIKAAYRTAAKRAHPDAGGSAEAMERVNEAHRVLSDPAERRAYDQRRTAPSLDHEPASHSAETSANPAPGPTAAHHHAAPRTAAHDPEAFARMRRRQARLNALNILQRSAIAAIVLTVITRYFLTLASAEIARIMLKIIDFIPIYGVLISIIFLLSPQIRLDLFDLTQHLRRRGPNPHLDRGDKTTLAALLLGFIPLVIVWLTLT